MCSVLTDKQEKMRGLVRWRWITEIPHRFDDNDCQVKWGIIITIDEQAKAQTDLSSQDHTNNK